jgi:hypothetical protein
LKNLRIAAQLSLATVATYYRGKGVSRARISQIEKSGSVNKTIECCYRAAIDVALAVRGKRRDMFRSISQFENPKTAAGMVP